MKTLQEIAQSMVGQDNEKIAEALAARCGKPVSKFFRNEARRLTKSVVAFTAECPSPKEAQESAAVAREYRKDRL